MMSLLVNDGSKVKVQKWLNDSILQDGKLYRQVGETYHYSLVFNCCENHTQDTKKGLKAPFYGLLK